MITVSLVPTRPDGAIAQRGWRVCVCVCGGGGGGHLEVALGDHVRGGGRQLLGGALFHRRRTHVRHPLNVLHHSPQDTRAVSCTASCTTRHSQVCKHLTGIRLDRQFQMTLLRRSHKHPIEGIRHNTSPDLVGRTNCALQIKPTLLSEVPTGKLL